MHITINNQSIDTQASSLQDVLTEWQAQPPYTVAVNKTFVPKHQHKDYLIAPGDQIDVLTPIQGG